MEEVSNRIVDASLNDVVRALDDIKDIQLAQLTLLMRIYDVQLANLNLRSSSDADEVFDLHENGRTANPPIWMREE